MRCNSVKESEIKVQLKLKMSSVVAFNMSASMEKAMVGLGRDLCVVLGEKYGFDGGAAMLELGLSVTTGQAKKVGGKAVKKTPTSVRAQPSIPLPFTGTIREDCCIGVKQNHGLYTQCFSGPGENGLCKGCAKQASKNASGEPDCGLIAKRVMQGSEYRDSKGRAPVHYTKVMKKQKLSEEQVLGEAAKFGIEIDASHFAIPQAQQKRGRPKKATTSDTESENSSSAADAAGEKKTRGRPKKAAKVVEVSETEDLFASLMQQAQSASPRPSAAGGGSAAADEVSDVSSDSESDSSESKGSKKKAKKSKEESEEELAEKAAKFLAKEEEKEKKAAARAAEKEAEKQKKALAQQEKEAEKQKKAAEKEAEKAKKLAEKEAEKEAEKAKKLAEKEAAKTAKAAKEEKPKKEKASKKKAEEPVKPVEPVADLESEAESEDEEPVVAVKKFEHQGVTYLKSSDGILYSVKSQEVVGKWNEKTQMIDVYDGESESEEESDSDDE